MRCRGKWRGRWLVGVLLLTPPDAVAAQCADVTPQEGENGYRRRGARCEGLIVQDTRSAVRLKSVLGSFQHGDVPVDSDLLRIALPAGVPAREYHLRVQSLDPRVHYQLDVDIPPEDGFTWPMSDVIGPAGIDAATLVPLGWATMDSLHYVPVSWTASRVALARPGPDTFLVILESTVPIRQLVAWLSRRGTGERTDPTLRSTLPATQVELTVPRAHTPGWFKLWVRARLLGEGAPEQQSWTVWLP